MHARPLPLLHGTNQGLVITGNGRNLAGKSNRRRVATLGVSDHGITETEESVMVCAKDRVQDIRRLVAKAKAVIASRQPGGRAADVGWGLGTALARIGLATCRQKGALRSALTRVALFAILASAGALFQEFVLKRTVDIGSMVAFWVFFRVQRRWNRRQWTFSGRCGRPQAFSLAVWRGPGFVDTPS